MKFIRHALIAATPFAFGLVLGLAFLPSDSQAAERADFAGISQMGDLACAHAGGIRRTGFFVTAFQSKVSRIPGKRNCTQQADFHPAAALAPKVKFGKVRAHFVWGQ